MSPATIEIINHGSSTPISTAWLVDWSDRAQQIVGEILTHHTNGANPPLGALTHLDVALVDDATSARVHADFMNIPGPTDVITFDHGEIVIGLEVAQRQAASHDELLPREIFRYLVHGILHLAGHRDAAADESATMQQIQESLVAKYWP